MRELLFTVGISDCTRQTFRCGGKGGQNQNKRDTGVRLIHEPSGARAEGREFRTQPQNEKSAWIKMTRSPTFQRWHKIETARRLGQLDDIDKEVDRMMRPENLLIEVGV